MIAGRSPQPITTYPPAPENRPASKEVIGAVRMALYSGRPEQAYRLALTAQPDWGSTPEWLDLASRVYLALDRPLRMAECLALLGASDPSASQRAAAVLDRQGPSPSPSLLPVAGGRLPTFDKQTARSIRGLLPGPEGSVHVLLETGILRVAPDGKIRASQPLQGAVDLSLDPQGKPVALGAAELLWGERRLPLPAGLDKPASACVSPDGSLLLLDRGAKRLYRLDEKGKVLGRADLALKDPSRVRTDCAGRIYVVDRSSDTVTVFGSGMAPVKVLTPEGAGAQVSKIEDIAVDFAGDVLLLDGRTKGLALLSPQGRLLGATPEGIRVDAAGWDGLGTLIYADRKTGLLGRLKT